MEITQAQMREFLRAIHARPGGTVAILNLVRASEVRGAADLSALTDIVADPRLKLEVTRHAMDEARHAYLLTRRLAQVGVSPWRLPPAVDRTEGIVARRRARDPKRVFEERGAYGDEEILESIVAMYLAEADAVPKLRGNFEVLAGDRETQAVFGSIIKDETRHVAYLERWLGRLEQRFSPAVVRETRERLTADFAELNVLFYGGLEDYLQSAAEASRLHQPAREDGLAVAAAS